MAASTPSKGQDIKVPPNLRVIVNGADLGLHNLRKMKRFGVGDLVFVPHANNNFCLAKIVQAHAPAHMAGTGSVIPVRVTKVHFQGWNYKEDMYVLQSELYEVSKEAFQTKLRVAQTFNQPMTNPEIRALMRTYESYKFGNRTDLEALRLLSSKAKERKVRPKEKKNLDRQKLSKTCRRASEGNRSVLRTPKKEVTDSKTAKSEPRRPTSLKRGAKPLVVEESKNEQRKFDPPKPISEKQRTKTEAVSKVKSSTQALESPCARRQTPSQKNKPNNQKTTSRVSRQSKPVPEDLETSPRASKRPLDQLSSEKTPSKRHKTCEVVEKKPCLEKTPQKPKIESKKVTERKNSEPTRNLMINKQLNSKGQKPANRSLPLGLNTSVTEEIREKSPVGRPTKKNLKSLLVTEDIVGTDEELRKTNGNDSTTETQSLQSMEKTVVGELRLEEQESEKQVLASSESRKPEVKTSDNEMGRSQRPCRTTNSIYKRTPQFIEAPKKKSNEPEALCEVPAMAKLTDRTTSSALSATCKVNQVEPIEDTSNSHRSLVEEDEVIPLVEPETIFEDEPSVQEVFVVDSLVTTEIILPQETTRGNQGVEVIDVDDSDDERDSSGFPNQVLDQVSEYLTVRALSKASEVEETSGTPFDGLGSKQTRLFGIYYNPNEDTRPFFEINPVKSAAELSTSELKEEIEYLACYYHILQASPQNMKCRVCHLFVNRAVFTRHVLAHLREKKLPILPFSRQYDELFHFKCTVRLTYESPHHRRFIDVVPCLGFPPRLEKFAKRRIMEVAKIGPSDNLMNDRMKVILEAKGKVLSDMRKMGMEFRGFWPESLECTLCNRTLKTPDIFEHLYYEMVEKKEFIRRKYINQTHGVFHHAGVCDKMYDSVSKEWLKEDGRLPSEYPELQSFYKKCSFLETETF